MAELEPVDDFIDFVDEPGELIPMRVCMGVVLRGQYRWRSRHRWVGGAGVACSFDVKSYYDKSPAPHEVQRFDDAVEPLHLGRPMTIHEDMVALSKADVFVGCSSGVGHLCRCGDTPLVMSYWHADLQYIRNWHIGWDDCTWVDNIEEAIECASGHCGTSR